MNSQEPIELVSQKLSALIALSLVPDVQARSIAEKVAMLTRFGIPNREIAAILGTTKATVEVLKSRAGKRNKRHGADQAD